MDGRVFLEGKLQYFSSNLNRICQENDFKWPQEQVIAYPLISSCLSLAWICYAWKLFYLMVLPFPTGKRKNWNSMDSGVLDKEHSLTKMATDRQRSSKISTVVTVHFIFHSPCFLGPRKGSQSGSIAGDSLTHHEIWRTYCQTTSHSWKS